MDKLLWQNVTDAFAVGGFELKLMSVPLLTTLAFLGGCMTETSRRATDNAAVHKEAAQEIKRICALPPAERATELERINKESGIVVQCGKD
jgi:hypothetical protein